MSERITYLITQKASGNITDSETKELDELLTEDNRDSIAGAVSRLLAAGGESLAEDRSGWESSIRQIVHIDSTGAVHKPVSVMGNRRRWWIAAATLFTICLSAYLWQHMRVKQTLPVAVQQEKPISPGSKGAILTLEDGSMVSLDTMQNGVITLQGGAAVTLQDGVLQYEGGTDNVVYNTMSTPRSRQFHLALSDGTNVWLNNASSIRYPVVFEKNERHVQITGEAYFEIAENAAAPFLVSINNQAMVEVLGTHFNVKAYSNETNMETTLLEGAVRVKLLTGPHAGEQAMLRPGQQARVATTSAGIQLLQSADIAKVMAWKNGLFHFEDVPLEEVMRQLERWYDVEVIYPKGIPQIELAGKMTRGVTLNELLVVLKELGVHCTLEDRKLIVQP